MPSAGQVWTNTFTGERVRVTRVSGAQVFFISPRKHSEDIENIPKFLLSYAHRA